MSPDARERLMRQLLVDEGVRLKPYRDTVGKLTIGVGRNLDDAGISHVEALYLLNNDLDRCIRELVAAFEWFTELDHVRQTILVNMVFNMGLGGPTRGLRSFKNTLRAIGEGRYVDASDGMRRSKWARQVGHRAERLARMMETGEWLDEANA